MIKLQIKTPFDIGQIIFFEWEDRVNKEYVKVKLGFSLFFHYVNRCFVFLRFYLGRPYATLDVLSFNYEEVSIELFDLISIGVGYGGFWLLFRHRKIFFIPFTKEARQREDEQDV